MQEKEINILNECYHCKHKRTVPGNAHIRCAKPDQGMTGSPHGIRMGWFVYPFLFDPVWKQRACGNFEEVKNGSTED